VSVDAGIQGLMLSSITNSLGEGGGDIVSPLERYQNHNNFHVIFMQEKIYDFKTINPRCVLLITNLTTRLYTLTAPTYSVNVKFVLYTSLWYMGKWMYSSTHS